MNKLLLVLAFFITGSCYATDDNQNAITILVEAHMDQKRQAEQSASLEDYLSAKMPANNIRVLFYSGNNNAILHDKVENAEVDYVITNPASTIILSQLYNTTPLLTRENANGNNTYGSVFFTSAKSHIQDLGAIDDLTIASNKEEGGAWLFGYAHLMEKDLYPHGYKDFKQISFLGDDETVVRSVISGLIDVGIVRTGILEDLIGLGIINKEDFRILEEGNSTGFGAYISTKTYPEWSLSSTTGPNQLQISEITKLFKDFEPSEAGFRWGELADYNIIKQQLRKYRMGTYKDPAHITYFKENYPFILAIFFLILFVYLYSANKIDKKLFQYKTRLERLSINSSMNRLLAEITHELSQPITSIRIDAEIIKNMSFKEGMDKNELQKVSGSMSYKTQQCIDIIYNIRNLIVNKETEKAVFDIKNRITGIINLIKTEVVNNNIEIINLNSIPTTDAYMSPIEFDQVLLNLFKNAISVISNNRKNHNFIKLTTKQDKSFTYLYVEDSGGLIQEPDMLFKLFKSTKNISEKEGFGLGLNLSRNIMRSHGGDLSLESTSINGSVFMLKIPKQK